MINRRAGHNKALKSMSEIKRNQAEIWIAEGRANSVIMIDLDLTYSQLLRIKTVMAK